MIVFCSLIYAMHFFAPGATLEPQQAKETPRQHWGLEDAPNPRCVAQQSQRIARNTFKGMLTMINE